MHTASVGFHCPECLGQGGQRIYTAKSLVAVPYVVYGIIAANVAVFVYGFARDNRLGDVSLPLLRDWSLWGPAIDVNGDWYRIVSSGFVHAGIIHIGLNMYLLYVLGQALEQRLGRVNFALVYAASLVGGSLGALVVDPEVASVGASGAVYGLMALYVVVAHRQRINIWASGIGGLVLINFLFTFAVDGISVGGHVGGFAAGLVAGAVAVYGGDRVPAAGATSAKMAVPAALAVLTVVLFAAAVGAAGTWSDPLF